MSAAKFRLLDVVHEVLATSGVADPFDLAAEVYNKIPKNCVHLALRQALKEVVRQQMSRDRLLDDRQGGRGMSNRKVTSYRHLGQQWERVLVTHRVAIDGEGHYKLLRDCTASDLDYVIKVREHMAAANQAKVEWYRRIQKATIEHEVAVLGDLPETVLRELLGDDESGAA